jgi:two-component system, OmpR family, sensor histidine kinase VicK
LTVLPNSKENNENDTKTEVLYGIENTISRGVQFMQNADERMDLFGEKNGPSIIIEFPDIYKNNYIAAKMRGVKIRLITEITKDNIHYCKELINIVSELRNLDGMTGGIAVTEKEYMTTTTLKRKQLLPQVFYSNDYEVVKQGQYIFDTFWDKAIPAEQKIKEIEEGIEPVKTKVLENQDDIYNHFFKVIKKSKERYICSSIGGMQMVYDNFFKLYKDIVEKQKKGEGDGIKWLTYIDGKKNNIDLVKKFINAGIQVKHIKNLPSMNFSVDANSIQATIERMDNGIFMNSLLVSNESAYVKHFTLFFQELWNNYGIDAVERIKDIKEGMEYDIEVIRHSNRTLDIYLDIVNSAQSEILFIFPTPKAFIRQLKAITISNPASKERNAKVRILTPSNELVEKWVKSLLNNEKLNQENSNYSTTNNISFSDNDIEIRYIEKMSHTRSTILIVDRKESLVMELKDDSKDTFVEAIGLSTHSNSKSSVLSYVAIFENLWKQSELYQEIKESNENLKMLNEKLEVNDKVLNEFIHIAAHELRNPIQPILGFSQIVKTMLEQIEKDHINKDQIFNLLDIIIRNARNLQMLSDEILDIAKIETNSLYLKKEFFSLKELLQIIVEEYKSQQRSNSLNKININNNNLCDIKFHSPIGEHQNEKLFLIEADKVRISQVISNLLRNALKFTNEGDLINVTIYTKDTDIRREVIVKISDTGSGIDPKIYPKLFTKFASKSEMGIGLGLFICKSIINAHGGKIWAENNTDGKGATFSFSLPVQDV